MLQTQAYLFLTYKILVPADTSISKEERQIDRKGGLEGGNTCPFMLHLPLFDVQDCCYSGWSSFGCLVERAGNLQLCLSRSIVVSISFYYSTYIAPKFSRIRLYSVYCKTLLHITDLGCRPRSDIIGFAGCYWCQHADLFYRPNYVQLVQDLLQLDTRDIGLLFVSNKVGLGPINYVLVGLIDCIHVTYIATHTCRLTFVHDGDYQVLAYHMGLVNIMIIIIIARR